MSFGFCSPFHSSSVPHDVQSQFRMCTERNLFFRIIKKYMNIEHWTFVFSSRMEELHLKWGFFFGCDCATCCVWTKLMYNENIKSRWRIHNARRNEVTQRGPCRIKCICGTIMYANPTQNRLDLDHFVKLWKIPRGTFILRRLPPKKKTSLFRLDIVYMWFDDKFLWTITDHQSRAKCEPMKDRGSKIKEKKIANSSRYCEDT